MDYGYDACGYYHEEILFYWDKDRLKQITSRGSMSEAGIFSTYSNYYFPKSKKGIRNGIVIETKQDTFDDKRNKYINVERTVKQYFYREGKFTEVK